MSNNIEEIRNKYRPEKIKVLLVGESPPAAGTFFYTGDSLTRYTQVAFQRIFPEVEKLSTEGFLKYFRDNGYYLDDLCLEPVNQMGNTEREIARRCGVDPLATRIRRYQPEHIIAIHMGSSDMVKLAALKAGLDHIPVHTTAFPSFSNQPRYINELEVILKKLTNIQSAVCTVTQSIHTPPSADDFERTLKRIFTTSSHQFVDVISGDLHRLVGGYPSKNHRMPICCQVMIRAMNSHDIVIYEPPSGQGASLHIRYKLPRNY